MSVGEIGEAVTAKSRARARFVYNTALFAGIAFNNPAAFPRSLSGAFPALFKKETDIDWREFKEYMKNYQKQHNKELAFKKRRGGRE